MRIHENLMESEDRYAKIREVDNQPLDAGFWDVDAVTHRIKK